MLGKTHMAVGIAATLAVTQPHTIPDIVLAAGVGAVGALIPDIDVGTSESHKDADRVTLLAVGVVIAVFIADYFFGMGIREKIMENSSMTRIVIGCIIFIGACAFGKEQPHRSFMHSFLALIILSFAMGLVWTRIVPYFAIGFLSHLATDIFNRRKVRLLYPLPGGFSLQLFSSHGIANTLFFVIGSVISVVEIGWLLLT